MDVFYRPGAGKAVYAHLLDAHIAEMVVGVEVGDLGRRVRVGVLLDLDEASLGVVGSVARGIAVVVGHAAAPGGGIGLEGVGALGIEAGERGGRLAHAGRAAELVVHGAGDPARAGGTLPRVLHEAHAAQVVILVLRGPVGIGVMPTEPCLRSVI